MVSPKNGETAVSQSPVISLHELTDWGQGRATLTQRLVEVSYSTARAQAGRKRFLADLGGRTVQADSDFKVVAFAI